MDSFTIHSIKLEKANAILRYHRLQKIATLLRFIELCIILIVISRFPSQCPFVFKLSGEYFRGLSVTLVSPGFVFVLGNVIILVLFLKSRQHSVPNDANNRSKLDSNDVKKAYPDNFPVNVGTSEELMVPLKTRESKLSKFQTHSLQRDQNIYANGTMFSSGGKIHRTRSEYFKRVHHEEACRELRRSVTERSLKSVNYGERKVGSSYDEEDEMSSEEFRRRVEAFIARQQRFLREEEFSTVLSVET